MANLSDQNIALATGPVHLRSGGKEGAPVAIFLHGGTPGLTPYCSGAHIWGDVLERFCADRKVFALDLPGSGATPATIALAQRGRKPDVGAHRRSP